MFTTSLATVGHVALACGLTFLLGFERQLRGSVAGDRTFSLIGIGTAVILILELRYIPYLRVLDARRWEHHFKDDTDPHHRHASTVTVTVTTNGGAGQASTANAAKDVALKESALESVSESAAVDENAADAPSSP